MFLGQTGKAWILFLKIIRIWEQWHSGVNLQHTYVSVGDCAYFYFHHSTHAPSEYFIIFFTFFMTRKYVKYFFQQNKDERKCFLFLLKCNKIWKIKIISFAIYRNHNRKSIENSLEDMVRSHVDDLLWSGFEKVTFSTAWKMLVYFFFHSSCIFYLVIWFVLLNFPIQFHLL